MNAKDITSVNGVSNYIEGCLNDFGEGLSDKDETNKALHELVARVIQLSAASQSTHTSLPSDEEIKEEAYKRYPLQRDGQSEAAIRAGKLRAFIECGEWMRDHPTIEGESEWISVEDRLPEKHNEIGVYHSVRAIFELHGTIMNEDVSWTHDNRFVWNCIDVTKLVSHWQPLPKPPLYWLNC